MLCQRKSKEESRYHLRDAGFVASLPDGQHVPQLDRVKVSGIRGRIEWLCIGMNVKQEDQLMVHRDKRGIVFSSDAFTIDDASTTAQRESSQNNTPTQLAWL